MGLGTRSSGTSGLLKPPAAWQAEGRWPRRIPGRAGPMRCTRPRSRGRGPPDPAPRDGGHRRGGVRRGAGGDTVQNWRSTRPERDSIKASRPEPATGGRKGAAVASSPRPSPSRRPTPPSPPFHPTNNRELRSYQRPPGPTPSGTALRTSPRGRSSPALRSACSSHEKATHPLLGCFSSDSCIVDPPARPQADPASRRAGPQPVAGGESSAAQGRRSGRPPGISAHPIERLQNGLNPASLPLRSTPVEDPPGKSPRRLAGPGNGPRNEPVLVSAAARMPSRAAAALSAAPSWGVRDPGRTHKSPRWSRLGGRPR